MQCPEHCLGALLLQFVKLQIKNGRRAHHSLELCLCSSRVLGTSLSIQNKAERIQIADFHSYEFALVLIPTQR